MSLDRIKKFLELGMISESEIEIILALYKKENRTKADEHEIIHILEKNLKQSKEKEEKYKRELAELEIEEENLLKNITELRIERAKFFAKKDAQELRKLRKEGENEIKKMGFEYKSLVRKIQNFKENTRKKIETHSLEKLREKLK